MTAALGFGAQLKPHPPAEQWDVVRYDVTLAAFWIALAIGTPTSIAGGRSAGERPATCPLVHAWCRTRTEAAALVRRLPLAPSRTRPVT